MNKNTTTPKPSPPEEPADKGLDDATCCASLFSPEQIEQWLTHMESIASASPQMAAVARMIRSDVQHPHDGIAAFFQHNVNVELPPNGGSESKKGVVGG